MKKLFLKVVVPASTPFILVGVRLGLLAALTTLIAAEMTGVSSGLGMMVTAAGQHFDMATVLMGIHIIGIIGLVLKKLVKYLERRLTGNTDNVKVKIDNVKKIYNGRNGEVVALNGVSLDIYDNEFICVIGPSGCGKSTLLNIIAGLHEATS